MSGDDNEIIDSQIAPEYVSFLDNCFDKSFSLQASLVAVKSFTSQIQDIQYNTKSKRSKNNLNVSKGIFRTSIQILSQSTETEGNKISKYLRDWGLPSEIVRKYEARGIIEMFDWQVTCLSHPKVLLECQNLVYSAPTSAGKTLVAEILTIKTVLERQKKVLIILPFVSIVREKMFYLQDILSSSGIRVEGFMGSQSPPGGLQAVHIAICTIEKANSLINRLLDENNISELGAVIVDELHLLGDPHRGYILELLLTKVKYVSSKLDIQIQIVGMSATLPNLNMLANWIEAQLFVTDFRPIPLDEYCLVGNKLYDKAGNCTAILKSNHPTSSEGDNVLNICLETIKDGCSILIFCMTKNRCESLAQSIASSFYKLGSTDKENGFILRQQLKSENIMEVLEQLKSCPVGLDQILKNTISFGVAYHHAGLTFDERDIVEGAFKSGAVRVLIATSTLSSGVNLPARKVIIRSPVFQRQPINILTYKQMIGRAGRMGKDTKGESILICTETEKKVGFDLMSGTLDLIKSCIESEDKFMRAVLEMIGSQVVCTRYELELYAKCTLLFTQEQDPQSENKLLENTLKELINFELVRIQEDGDLKRYIATSLGKACLSSSMAPNDGLSLFCEMQKARQCLVLETDLHLIYLVTPYSVSNQWSDIDWLHLLTLWESLTKAMKRVGELVGIRESFIIQCLRGTNKLKNCQDKLSIHKRFYTALALQDLVNEVPLSEVATKFQCARGFLQGLQQSAATFAGMVTAFCHQLGWRNMEMLISQFQDRLHFGVHSELLELMKLPSLNGIRARALCDLGYETIANVASAELNTIENILYKAVPFQSEKERDGDDETEMRKRNKLKNVWITGCCGMTARKAAENLISQARKHLEQEIGVKEIMWDNEDKSSKLQSEDVKVADIKEENISIVSKLADISVKSESNIQSCAELNSDTESMLLINTTKNDEINFSLKQKILQNGTNNNEESLSDSLEIKNEKGLINTNSENGSKMKEEFEWASLNITETGFDDISKLRKSDNIFSPNISFGDSDDKLVSNNVMNDATAKNTSDKDVSLFSTDGDNSSLFEESLPLDQIPNTLMSYVKLEKDTAKPSVQESTLDYLNINSNTIINAFKLTIDMDDEQDLKLVYEDEAVQNKVTPEDHEAQGEELCSQLRNETSIKNIYIISPLKRNAEIDEKNVHPSAKKIKIETGPHLSNNIEINCNMSENFIISIDKRKIKCFVLRDCDIVTNWSFIENIKVISIIMDTNITMPSNNMIGSNLIKKSEAVPINNNVSPIRGIALCLNESMCVYLDLFSISKKYIEKIKRNLSTFFENVTRKMLMVSLKTNFVQIRKYFNKLISTCYDVLLAEWLVDNDERISTIVELLMKYCQISLTNVPLKVNNIEKMYQKMTVVEDVCLKAWCVWNIAAKQEQFLMQRYQFAENVLNVEMQIAKILANCEYLGLAVDRDLAAQLLVDVRKSQDTLQKKAYKLCGYEFNFNSSKEVAKALGMVRSGRRTKISTKKSILTAHNSPMASIVIFWRKLNTILTKTLYPLMENTSLSNTENRVRPSYTMFTCTGRISMHKPNLQNVPRTFSIPLHFHTPIDEQIEPCDDVIEFNCRNVFKAAPGHVFVSADYCQLEMRILTHYSGDKVLTRIMNSDADVFKSIAVSWSGLPEDQVDDDLRQKAKQLCYGILYGMGNKTLSQHLDVTELEAAVFMDTFYRTYPAIKVFTQSVIDECRKKGYVETLTKRRRYLPDINVKEISKRSAAERQAVNTTIQGSAADIAKAAMCALDTRTENDVFKPQLVLQMHDELIYEVRETNQRVFTSILKEVMENTVQLNVPLRVKMKCGYSWGALEEFK